MAQERSVYSYCMGSGCHEGCVLTTYVENEKIVRCERTDFTGAETDVSGICAKGIALARFNDIEHRIHYPLKRIGKRGEGTFERISWDQAISEICEKLIEIREKYGPRSLIFNQNPSGYPNLSCSNYPNLQNRFIQLFDCSASQFNSFDNGFFGSDLIDLGSGFMFGQSDRRLMAFSKYLLIWGSNPLGNTRAAATTRYMLDAQENGAKLVHIGLVYNSTAAKCDQFIAMRRGNDVFLALAMAREIIRTGAHDEEYVRRFTVGPFLVRDDNGTFLRMNDIEQDGSAAEYVVWDEAAHKPIGVAPYVREAKNAQLVGSVTVAGIACKPAFQLLIDHVEPYTPEYQEQHTGVCAQTMLDLAHEYARIKPANIFLEEALRYQNGLQSYRAIQLLAAITGNMALKGGGLTLIGSGLGWGSYLNPMALLFPIGLENAKGNYVYPSDAFGAGDDDDCPYKAFFSFMGNPVHSNPGRATWEKLLSRMELIVVHDIWESDTAQFADYLLPDTTVFERSEVFFGANHFFYQDAAVQPAYEEKSGSDVLSLIAQGVGLGEYFQLSHEEWIKFRVETGGELFDQNGELITYERIKEEKMIRLNKPEELYDSMIDGNFVTDSGRFEFYSEDFVEVGAPMATYMPAHIDRLPQEIQEAYPMHLFVGRARMFMQTQPFMVMPDLLAITEKEPWAWINADDAAEANIRNNEYIEVYNDRGMALVKARTTQAVPRGMVNLWLNFRKRDYKKGGATEIQMSIGTKETLDEFAECWKKHARRRWGIPEGEKPSIAYAMQGKMPDIFNWEASINGNYDCIWDSRCAIRKAQ